MIYLSDYEQRVFKLIESLEIGQSGLVKDWAKPETTKDFIEAIKKRIDMYDDCEFNGDYTKFKRIRTWKQHIKYRKDNKLTNKINKK